MADILYGFPQEFLDKVRARVLLSEVAREKTRLVKRGENWFGCCPFHREKTPSFKVNDGRGFYHCFGCGAHGDIFSFVMEQEKITFPASVELLAEKGGLEIPQRDPYVAQDQAKKKRLYTLIETAALWYTQRLNAADGEEARAYLSSRGVTQQTQEQFRLGFAPRTAQLAAYMMRQGFSMQELIDAGLCLASERGRPFERFRRRLIFPIFDARGRCVGFGGRLLTPSEDEARYLNSPESKIFSKGAVLYGYSLARGGDVDTPILLVEGYMDVISLHQAGFTRAVAPLGTAANEEQISECWKLSPEPTIMFDGDAAGRGAALRLLERLVKFLKPGHSVRFAFLPSNEDPDSFIRNKGKEAFRSLVAQAQAPLDVLWMFHTQDISETSTPEQRALVIERLRTLLSEIQHPEIRRLYQEDLAKRWAEMLRLRRFSAKKALSKPPLLPSSSKDLPFKILLATLLNHPSAFPSIEEDFITIEPPENAAECSDLRNLQQILLEVLGAETFENQKSLLKRLHDRVGGDVLRGVCCTEVFSHAPFARPQSSSEDAVRGFREVHRRFFRIPSLEADIRQARKLLEASFSEENWQRLKELQALWQKEKALVF